MLLNDTIVEEISGFDELQYIWQNPTLRNCKEQYFISAWMLLQAWYSNWPECIHVGCIRENQLHILSAEVHPEMTIDAWVRDCSTLVKSEDMCMPETLLGDFRELTNTETLKKLKNSIFLQEFGVSCFYNKNFYDREAVYRLLQNLEAILTHFFHTSSDPIHKATSLSIDEHHQIMRFMEPFLPEIWNNESIIELIQQQVAKNPHHTAIRQDATHVSYYELEKYSNSLACKLQNRGVQPGVRIAIYMSRSPEIIISMLAIIKAGASFIPIDPKMPSLRIDYILENASVQLVMVDSETKDKLSGVQVLEVSTCSLKCGDAPKQLVANREAYVIYTSGTTGDPKGISISTSSLTYYSLVARNKFSITQFDKVLQFSSLSFDAMIEEIFPALISGAEVVLRDEATINDLDAFLEAIKEQDITILDLPTAYWKELAKTENLQEKISSTLRLVIIGGEAVDYKTVAQWKETLPNSPQLINTYGPTETTVVTTMWSVPDNPTFTTPPIGKPIPGSLIFIVDRLGKIAPIGAIGEIHIAGPGLSLGYVKDAKKTNEKFITIDSVRFFKSGDFGRYLPDGNIEYLGREDNQVKINGFRVELDEIKNILLAHHSVKDALVLALHSETRGDFARIGCFVLLQNSNIEEEENLQQYLNRSLPYYMLPSKVRILQEFPKLISGKIDIQKLKKLYTNSNEVLPECKKMDMTVLEISIAKLWEEILQVPVSHNESNFFELGGTSLDVIRLMTKLHKFFNIKLHANQMYITPTLRGIATAVQALLSPQGSSVPENNTPYTPNNFTKWRHNEAQIHKRASPTASSVKNGAILLTGATGFLGIHLLHALLKNTQMDVYCLVRASSSDKAYQRILDTAQKNHLFTLNDTKRIIALPGDITKENFGLDGVTFSDISSSVGAILHSAAEVNMLLQYEALKATNVTATKRVIEFAQTGRHKELHYISSLAIFDGDECIDVNEDSALEHVSNLSGGYAQSKWIADKAVINAIDHGLTAKIYRCGRIWGCSKTGKMPANDFIWKFINGCIKMGSIPEVAMTLDVMPVDFLSTVITALMTRAAPNQNIYHLANSNPLLLNNIHAFLSEAGKSVEVLSYAQWRSVLKEAADDDTFIDHVLAPIASIFDTEHPTTWVERYFPAKKTELLLKEMGFIYPEITSQLFKKYLDVNQT